MDGKVHPADAMTSRERLLAAYQGRGVDRLPFWAKVANSVWRLGQPEPVRQWSDLELFDYIHADGIFGSPGFVRPVTPHAEVEATRSGNVRTLVTHTPDGDLVERWAMDPLTESWHPRQFPVKTREDVARLRGQADCGRGGTGTLSGGLIQGPGARGGAVHVVRIVRV